MALTLPIYINVDTQTSAALNASAVRGEAANTNPSAVDQGTVPITRGIMKGVRVVKSAHSGNVTLKAYADSAGAIEVYSNTFTFTSPAVSVSDDSTNIPFFSGLWWTVLGDGTSATHTCNITFYIRSIAGNS
tara:strand:- start:347 stop:742 length:396 start_codon:yes stop_codon:yes gene_type:complete